MSLQQIYDDLNKALNNGVIDLTAATVPGLGLTLEAYGVETLRMTGADLALGPNSVILTGNANYRNFAWTSTLTGESVPAGNRFTLTLQGQDASKAWTFGTSFTELPGSRVQDTKGALPLGPSIIGPLVVQQPLLSVTTQPPKPAKRKKRLAGAKL